MTAALMSEDGYDWVALEGMPQQPSLLTNEVNSENKYSIPNLKINLQQYFSVFYN